MATIPRLLTVEEFEQLPDPAAGYYELHGGHLVHMPPPKKRHIDLQQRIRDILAVKLGEVARVEFPYKPLLRMEFWYADVAWLKPERYEQVPEDNNLIGSPDICVEVLSPSNRPAEIAQKRSVTMAGGCGEFWVVDPANQTVTVNATTYHAGEQFDSAAGARFSVNELLGIRD